MDLSDLMRDRNANNDGGLKRTVFLADADLIDSIPAPAAAPANYGEVVTISADIIHKSGGCFHKIETFVEHNQLDMALVGSKGSLSEKYTVTLDRDNIDASTLGWIRSNRNAPFVLIIGLLDGKFLMLGDKDLPVALINSEGTTGRLVEDDKHIPLIFEAVGQTAFYYEGEISLTPAL
jgi:hypothetical protein